MSASLVVRRASAADTASVAPLFDAYRQFYGLGPDLALSRQFLAERLERNESVVLIAEQASGQAVGFVQMYPTFSSLRAARMFVLYDLFVEREARRLGVARALMHSAVEEARAAGAVALTLQTARTNAAAQRLYESLGWKCEDEFLEYGLSI
jgi:ribosomal protein S18 acetylase RimI-like enzyme